MSSKAVGKKPLPKILIVEGHRDFRRAVLRLLVLRRIKAQLFEASSGEEGVIIARREKPKVVIIDLMLKGISGLEVARKIKRFNPDCMIIMLTMFGGLTTSGFMHKPTIDSVIEKDELFYRLFPVIRKVI